MFYANIDTKYNSRTSNISFNFLIFNFFLILNIQFCSLNFQVPLGCIRRLRVKNLIPLDLEIKETLRRIQRDKRETSWFEHQPMEYMEDLREEEVGSKMGDGMTPDTTQMDNVL